MTDIPVLTTERLTLRGLEARDFCAYAEMMADPQVTRYLGAGQPLSREDAWRQLAMFIGHWHLRGFGLWAVENRATGEFLGRIGCIQPEGWPGFEVGYTLARAHWGHGYAQEGARAALDFAHRVLVKRGVISLIRRANLPSIFVATALGARLTGQVEFFGSETDVYTYPDPLL